MTARPDRRPAAGDRPVGRAAFLGGLLSFVALIELSVIGLGHARTLEGEANAQFWIVVGLVAGVAGFVTAALGRTEAATAAGEAARRGAVIASWAGIVLFVWECVAIGSGAFSGPLELASAALFR